MEDQAKPLFVYDGDCGFCRTWVNRWRVQTQDRVDYAPFQEVAGRYPHISPDRFAAAAQLIEPDGLVYERAEAVLRALQHAPGHAWMLWCYRRLPLVAPVSECAYRFVANHRKGFSALTRVFWGKPSQPTSYDVTRSLFLRLLGVVYFIAFLSLGVQIVGLVGENGIVPAAAWLEDMAQRLGNERYWRVPTLAWIDASDASLKFLCYGGAGLSLLLIVGVAPLAMLILLWIFYLSITTIGGVFLHFQWDNLLLETGLLAVFLAPFRLFLGSSKTAPPSRIALWLLRWLLFRLMFLSGMVKLASHDAVWWDLTALTVHYETQPLPTLAAWYAHHLPLWFHKFSCGVMFGIELILPFFIFGPRRLRQIAAATVMGFMILIGITGNYNFFNLITIILCVLLLDDNFLRRFMPRGRSPGNSIPNELIQTEPQALACAMSSATSTAGHTVLPESIQLNPSSTARWARRSRRVFHLLVAGLILVLSTAQGFRRFGRLPDLVEEVRPMLIRIAPFRSINSYGLFANMTESRPEIMIEGSGDGVTWEEYEFFWKPGDVKRRPRWVQPHQPRLDWQMWFAALGRYQRNPWLISLLRHTLEGTPEVLAFYEKNPFPEQPPKFVRAVLYDYRFTKPDTRRNSGAWWHRERRGLYCPPLTLERGRLRWVRR